MMSDVLCVVIYLPLFVIAIYLFFTAYEMDSYRYINRQHFVFFFSILTVWCFCEFLYFLVPLPWVVELADCFTQALHSAIAVGMFLMIASFYKIDQRISKRTFMGLCLIPLTTMILACTFPLHSLLYQSFEVLSTSPSTIVESTRGIWYYINLTYSVLLNIGITVILISSYQNLPGIYRGRSFFLWLGMIIFFLCSCLELFRNTRFPLDYALIGTGFSGLLFYLMTQVSYKIDYLDIERRNIFHYLDEGVVILNTEDQIVDANRVAQNLLHLDETVQSVPFQSVLEDMAKKGQLTRKLHENDPNEDIFFLEYPYPVVYEMSKKTLKDREDKDTGRCVILSNVTNRRLYMERLKETIGIDVLTGLPNRFRYHELLRLLDIEENLPLSVIICDIKELKSVNSIYGHYEGDLMLKAASNILQKSCPRNGFVSRVGGDAFIMLLPKCAMDEVERVIERIYITLIQLTEDSQLDIAFRYATKTKAAENLSELINKAVMSLYDREKVTMSLEKIS